MKQGYGKMRASIWVVPVDAIKKISNYLNIL